MEKRHTPSIEESPESLRIVMPVQRIGCVAVFLGLWLVGWVAGELSALSALFRVDTLLNPVVLFLLVWLVGWTAGGLAAATLLALVLDGSEIVTFTPDTIDRRVEAFGRGLNWKYAMVDVSNVRPTGGDDGVKDFISFDHKGKTIRFGTNLNETVAERATAAVWAKFPQLMPRTERIRREEAGEKDYASPSPESAPAEPPAAARPA